MTPPKDNKKAGEINYVQKGRTIECGTCHPEKFGDCKELTELYKLEPCDCICHEPPKDNKKAGEIKSKCCGERVVMDERRDKIFCGGVKGCGQYCEVQTPEIKVVPSPRIDWCSDCKKEHGFECPPEINQRDKWLEVFRECYDDNEAGGSSRWLVAPTTVEALIAGFIARAEAEARKDEREYILEIIKTEIIPCLKYCEAQNGLPYCKNCGLDDELIRKLEALNKQE